MANAENAIWDEDVLGFKEKASAFTKLIGTFDRPATISIEASYGRGKTFFRSRWARELEAADECVVEIDAQLSDHLGDPVVTFIGALLELVPEAEQDRLGAAIRAGKVIAIAGAKALGRAVLKEGIEEIASGFGGQNDRIKSIIDDVGSGLSDAAGELIATRLAAEKASRELKQEIRFLHALITEGRPKKRIVVIIDELDRCHPEYALKLIEAMKLIFGEPGFVFVLMVNRSYLEDVAKHRFGGAADGESYLDKFVDLRLQLSPDNPSAAARQLIEQLPDFIPFGDHEEFSKGRAAELVADLLSKHDLPMRQIKRTIERLELVCRLYVERPIDLPLLTLLAFAKVIEVNLSELSERYLKRAVLTAGWAEGVLAKRNSSANSPDGVSWGSRINYYLRENFKELLALDPRVDRAPNEGRPYNDWQRILVFLAPTYHAEHLEMLEAVHVFQPGEEKTGH